METIIRDEVAFSFLLPLTLRLGGHAILTEVCGGPSAPMPLIGTMVFYLAISMICVPTFAFMLDHGTLSPRWTEIKIAFTVANVVSAIIVLATLIQHISKRGYRTSESIALAELDAELNFFGTGNILLERLNYAALIANTIAKEKSTMSIIFDKEVHSNTLAIIATGYKDWARTKIDLYTYLKQMTERKSGWGNIFDESIEVADLDLVVKAVESWAKWIVEQDRSYSKTGGDTWCSFLAEYIRSSR